jgi:hypothetical protein
VGTEPAVDAPGEDARDRGPIVLILSRRHAEALSMWVAATCTTPEPWLESVRAQLPRAHAQTAHHPTSPADSVLAAAQAVVGSAHTDLVAEREASDVAQAVVSTEKSVMKAAQTTARAATDERNRKADAADTAAQELAHTAVRTAAVVQERADAMAERVASAADRAAEIVAASIATGGDAEAALAALQLAATVDAAAMATAEDTALAAAAVATAVARAAAQAALAAATAAAVFEQEVANAAAAVRVIATTAARDLAVETDAKAVEVALDARRSRLPTHPAGE